MTVTNLEILQAQATFLQGQIDNIDNQANLQKLRLQQQLDAANSQIASAQVAQNQVPEPAQPA